MEVELTTDPQQWWRFWRADTWRSWFQTRRAWTAFKQERSRLDDQIDMARKAAKEAQADVERSGRSIGWLTGLGPRQVPVKTTRTETGLASVPNVTRFETRKTEGGEVWTPVDSGPVYFTDRQMVFAGRKEKRFRFDHLVDVESVTRAFMWWSSLESELTYSLDLQNSYDVEISPELVSRITDAVLPELRERQSRPLDHLRGRRPRPPARVR